MNVNEDLTQALKRLKLNYLATNLDEFVTHETRKRSSPRQLLEHMVELETSETHRRSITSRLRQAKLEKYKPWADFDWSWPEKISQDVIDTLFTLDFVAEPSNIIFLGTAGLGKTMCAKNLAYQAILSGHTALFTETATMLDKLTDDSSPLSFKARLARYLKPKVLVLDELGYLSYSSKSADIIFQVISRRYEKSATIVTTNKAFKEWGAIFPGAACVNAMIDRLTHHAEIVRIEGKSYRKHESEQRRAKKSPTSKKSQKRK